MLLPKYTSIFAATIKSVASQEKNKYLALANLQELQKFIPNVDLTTNIDLLPVSFSVVNANRVNKNGDVVNTDTALSIYKSFINKYICVEHMRDKCIGCIVSASLSEYGTEKPLKEEDVKGSLKPFNVTLGGIIWRVVNKGIAELLEETNDPDSPDYMSVSASWELGFSQYQIVGMEGNEKNIESSKLLITKPEEVEEASKNLKALGGTGKIGDLNIYRMPVNDALPLGVGLTENPAADVKGVAVEPMNQVISIATTTAIEKINENIVNNISHTQETNVKDIRIIMKVKSVSDINESNWKELTASAVTDFVTVELQKANQVFLDEKQAKLDAIEAKDKEILTAKEALKNLEAEKIKTNETLTQLQASLDKINAENAQKQKLEIFQQRMTAMDDIYELSKEDREVISASIKDLDDSAYKAFEKNMSILMKDKNKEYKKSLASTATVVVASTTQVIDTAIDTAKVTTTAVAATTTAAAGTTKEKYSKTFGLDQVKIS